MLNQAKIMNAKPKDKPYKMGDYGGLYLLVKPNGSMLWGLKYYYLQKEKKLSLGVYPYISLADAREAREDAKKLLAKGKDPSQVKKEEKRMQLMAASNSFEKVAREWFEHESSVWVEKTRYTKMRRLEMYVFPVIGHLPITDITPMILLDCIQKVEARKAHDVARRLKQIMSRIFKYAVLRGKANGDPSHFLTGALKPFTRGHYAAISPEELPEFVAVMNRNDHRVFLETRLGMELMLLTFVRTNELIAAQWEEFNLDKAMWIIPAQRMKTRKEHMVPLSSQVVERLVKLKELAGRSPWVLPSQCNSRKHMSNNTIRTALIRMGYGGRMTGHGFRALAMSTIKEKLGYRHEVVDRQLAHVHHNSVNRAYDRAQFLGERTEMMQTWANYIDQLSGRTVKEISNG